LCSELSLCQFIDSASYARLRIQFQIQEPVEVVIVPETFGEKVSSMNAILELIRNTYPEVEITMQLASAESSNLTPEICKKYYCMAAAGALIKHVESIQNLLFAQNSLKVTYQVLEKSCFMGTLFLRCSEFCARSLIQFV
uniref:KH_dom_type_1 domain-containing protein n=1 Tax=Gongylonema pulchrum TaxID=637853 RepID=A0A183D303_9BILA